MFFSKTQEIKNDFVEKYSFEDRKNEIDKIFIKHPNKIPIYINKAKNSNINDIKKHKYLVPQELTIGEFMVIIRKNIQLQPEQAITLFIQTVGNNVLMVPTSETMGSVYNKNVLSLKNSHEYKKLIDGYLYIVYSGENTFG